jgi:hypothetical protein
MVGVKVQACRDEVEEQGGQANKITKYKIPAMALRYRAQCCATRCPSFTEVRSKLSMALLEKDEQ